MAGTTLYLIRSNNLTFAKQEGVIDVFLSGSQTAYASVTGNATTNVVTITGATLANGMQVTFTNIVGGSGLTANTAYYVVAASGATCQLSLTQGGSAIDFTTNITAGSVIVSNDQMRVWSSEFRDIFTGSGLILSNTSAFGTATLPTVTSVKALDPVVGPIAVSTSSPGSAVSAPIKATTSDEILFAKVCSTRHFGYSTVEPVQHLVTFLLNIKKAILSPPVRLISPNGLA
jgi:hypothetical protein